MPWPSLFVGLALAGILEVATTKKCLELALLRLNPEKAPDRSKVLYPAMNGEGLQMLMLLTMRRRSSPRFNTRRHIKLYSLGAGKIAMQLNQTLRAGKCGCDARREIFSSTIFRDYLDLWMSLLRFVPNFDYLTSPTHTDVDVHGFNMAQCSQMLSQRSSLRRSEPHSCFKQASTAPQSRLTHKRDIRTRARGEPCLFVFQYTLSAKKYR